MEGFEFELLGRKAISKDRGEFAYSFNWPYDFFSLVEVAKLDAEAFITPKRTSELPSALDPSMKGGATGGES